MITPTVKKELRLRRKILQLADACKAAGEISGQTLIDILEDGADGVSEADEILRLATDLVNLSLLTARDSRTMKHQRPGLIWMYYRITARGTELLSGVGPIYPLVEDDRI